MRTAICLLGQMRTFDATPVRESFSRFITERLNPDVFVATWDKRGHSHWAEYSGMDISYSNENISASQILDQYHAVNVAVENYDDWLASISEERRLAAQSPRLRCVGQ